MLVAPSPAPLPRRLLQLLPGLVLCGVGLALMVLGGLGLGPWEVLHQGISRRTGVPIGTVGIGVGALVLLAWLPLRQRLGIGTLCNVVLIGVVLDGVLAAVEPPAGAAARWALLLTGVVAFAAGSGLYIGAGLGAGPRDGLMTGLAARSGVSVRLVRTGLELGALTAGSVLGGDVGPGTVAFALAIGPLVQLFLGWLSLPVLVPATD